MENLTVVKVMNNNVIIASHPQHGEVVVIGKGVGFGRKVKDSIKVNEDDKMFILRNEKEKELYKRLLLQVDERLIEVMNDSIFYISQHAGAPINEHIHIALTDHIAFAVMRCKQGIVVHNPFKYETREFYPKEYKISEHVMAEINRRMAIDLPEDEIGFVALHIHSAIANRPVGEVRENSELIVDLVSLIERSLEIKVDKESLHYSRMLRHLIIALERIRRGEQVEEPSRIMEIVKTEYAEMYSLAWKLLMVIQQRLHRPVHDAEAVFLTMHLERIVQHYHATQKGEKGI